MNLVHLGLAWLCGLELANRLRPPGLLLVAGGLLCLALLLWRRTRRFSGYWAGGLLFFLAAGRFALSLPVIDERNLAYYNYLPRVALTGVVSEFPLFDERQTSLRLSAESIKVDGKEQPVHGDALLQLPHYPAFEYGDRLRVTGPLGAPPAAGGSGYRDYLARRGIYSSMKQAHAERLSSDNGPWLLRQINAFRDLCRQIIQRLFAEPYAALLSGILLGLDEGIPKELLEQFNITGVSHIIAISGFNISLVAGFLLYLTKRLFGMKYAPWAAMAGIGLYALLAGAGASVLRAAVMAGIAMLALLAGRPGASGSSLSAAGILLTCLNPQSYLDVDFQLSFAATLGLVVLSPRLESAASTTLGGLLNIQKTSWFYDLIKDGLLLTMAAQIYSLPIIAYQFGRISIVGLLTNFLVLPVQPLVMIGGAAAVILGFVFTPLARLAAMLAWLPLAWTVAMVRVTSGFPLASLTISRGERETAAVVLALAAVSITICLNPDWREAVVRRLKNAGTALLTGLVMMTILVWLAPFSLPDGRLHVRLLNVGQGDAVLIITPAGKNILIDGGPTEEALLNELGGRLPFWDHTLSLVVNTHPQADHLAGLLGALKHYQVENIMANEGSSNTPLETEWRRQFTEKGITTIPGLRGTVVELGKDIHLRVLHPQSSEESEDENRDSIVTLLEYGETRFLFTGDIDTASEEQMMAAGNLPAVNVLKVAHHGSRTGLTPRLLEGLSPSVALISVGENRFGQPDPEVLKMLEDQQVPVYRTDRDGAIEIISDGRHLWLKKEEQ